MVMAGGPFAGLPESDGFVLILCSNRKWYMFACILCSKNVSVNDTYDVYLLLNNVGLRVLISRTCFSLNNIRGVYVQLVITF